MQSEWANSIRRACAVILLDPKVYRYKLHRPDLAALEQRIKEIYQTPVRTGYRRMYVLLRRGGWALSFTQTYRKTREGDRRWRHKHQQQPGTGQGELGGEG